jgi:hypothetical protein
MRDEGISNKVLDSTKLDSQCQQILIGDGFRAVHPDLVVERKHDVPILYPRRRQYRVRALPPRHYPPLAPRKETLFWVDTLLNCFFEFARGETTIGDVKVLMIHLLPA